MVNTQSRGILIFRKVERNLVVVTGNRRRYRKAPYRIPPILERAINAVAISRRLAGPLTASTIGLPTVP